MKSLSFSSWTDRIVGSTPTWHRPARTSTRARLQGGLSEGLAGWLGFEFRIRNIPSDIDANHNLIPGLPLMVASRRLGNLRQCFPNNARTSGFVDGGGRFRNGRRLRGGWTDRSAGCVICPGVAQLPLAQCRLVSHTRTTGTNGVPQTSWVWVDPPGPIRGPKNHARGEREEAGTESSEDRAAPLPKLTVLFTSRRSAGKPKGHVPAQPGTLRAPRSQQWQLLPQLPRTIRRPE